MELTEKRIRYLKYNMIFFGSILFSSLLAGYYLAGGVDVKHQPRLYLWGCILTYLTIRISPIAGFSVMLYFFSLGYFNGVIREYVDHPTRGELTGSEARTFGRNQIIFGLFVFCLSLSGWIVDVSVLSDCPHYFYDATWTQIINKLF